MASLLRPILRSRPATTALLSSSSAFVVPPTSSSRLLVASLHLRAGPTPLLMAVHRQGQQQQAMVVAMAGGRRGLSSISADEAKEAGKKASGACTDCERCVCGANEAGEHLHFKLSPSKHPLDLVKHDIKEKVWENPFHHSVWTKVEVSSVKVTHLEPKHWTGVVAYHMAKGLRFAFDLLAGFKHRVPDEAMWLNRIIFLETVAAVPGMVGGMVRHLHSLRLMRRDHGWIFSLLEEAENERMHLLTFIGLKQPGPFFRGSVVLTQGVFLPAFFCAYVVSPRLCHSLVGYIEEEAVRTYTHIIEEIDAGHLPLFESLHAPPIAKSYWKLAPDAMFRDLILAVRMDEANHREVNHTFASLKHDDYNPFLAQEKKKEYHATTKVVDVLPIRKKEEQ